MLSTVFAAMADMNAIKQDALKHGVDLDKLGKVSADRPTLLTRSAWGSARWPSVYLAAAWPFACPLPALRLAACLGGCGGASSAELARRRG